MIKPNYSTDRIVWLAKYLLVAIPYLTICTLQFLTLLIIGIVLVIAPYYFFADKLSWGFATLFANIPGVSPQFAQVVLVSLPLIGIVVHILRLHREDEIWKDLFGLRERYKDLVGIEGHVILQVDDSETEEE